MVNLARASGKLFSSTPDKTFDSFQELFRYCSLQKERSLDRLVTSVSITPTVLDNGQLGLSLGSAGKFRLNEFSFGQLCVLAGVDKAWVNGLSANSASKSLNDNFRRRAPGQLRVLTAGDLVRAIQTVDFKRLYNADLLEVLRKHVTRYVPISNSSGVTSLYIGEQHMTCSLIDPTERVEIGSETFTPGISFWNSEAGEVGYGIEKYWCQSVTNRLWWEPWNAEPFIRELKAFEASLEEVLNSRNQRRETFLNRMSMLH